MAPETKDRRRSQIGYGSSYRKGTQEDFQKNQGIKTVLGGQVWMVSPDKDASTSNPCIWMQAGVAKFKNCNNFYDCSTCKYDLGMQKQVAKGKQISWQDAMRKRPDLDRTCRHSLTLRIENRACAYDYQCGSCDFDQYFEDVWTPKTGVMPFEMKQVKGFDMPIDCHFHNGHTWARIESGGNIRIGLDDFSLKLLGKADGFDLPLMGKELDQGAPGWGLKREKNAADILSPVSGVIMEVNSRVREVPELANQDPYGNGWLFLIRTPEVKKTMKSLMAETDSMDWIHSEISNLESMIEEVSGPLTADGGYLTDDIYGALPSLGWDKLTKKFLKT